MTREDIEQAAEKYTEEAYLHKGDDGVSYHNGFIAGSEWRINSVWHEASKKPDKGSAYLVIKHGYNLQTVYWSDIVTWEEFQLIYRFKLWAYIDDLLPIKD